MIVSLSKCTLFPSDLIPERSSEKFILCPVLFEPYKYMTERLTEWVTAVDDHIDPAVCLLVTATTEDVPPYLAANRRIKLLGQLNLSEVYSFGRKARRFSSPRDLSLSVFPWLRLEQLVDRS